MLFFGHIRLGKNIFVTFFLFETVLLSQKCIYYLFSGGKGVWFCERRNNTSTCWFMLLLLRLLLYCFFLIRFCCCSYCSFLCLVFLSLITLIWNFNVHSNRFGMIKKRQPRDLRTVEHFGKDQIPCNVVDFFPLRGQCRYSTSSLVSSVMEMRASQRDQLFFFF